VLLVSWLLIAGVLSTATSDPLTDFTTGVVHELSASDTVYVLRNSDGHDGPMVEVGEVGFFVKWTEVISWHFAEYIDSVPSLRLSRIPKHLHGKELRLNVRLGHDGKVVPFKIKVIGRLMVCEW
jgi:hypothetical protein